MLVSGCLSEREGAEGSRWKGWSKSANEPSVLARMNGSERSSRVREGFHGDCLVSVIGWDVLEGLDWGERGFVLGR